MKDLIVQRKIKNYELKIKSYFFFVTRHDF
jgi:hypothetical protein